MNFKEVPPGFTEAEYATGKGSVKDKKIIEFLKSEAPIAPKPVRVDNATIYPRTPDHDHSFDPDFFKRSEINPKIPDHKHPLDLRRSGRVTYRFWVNGQLVPPYGQWVGYLKQPSKFG